MNQQLQELDVADLDNIVGGGWKSKLFKGIVKFGRKVGSKVGEGVMDGFKAIGKWGTVAGASEGASRGIEKGTGGKVRLPRPSDAVK